MVTAPTIHYDEQITLPEGSKSKQTETQKTITLQLNKDRKVLFNNSEIDLDRFEDESDMLFNDYSRDETVFLQADELLEYKDIMKLLKVMKEKKFHKISFITQ